MGRAVPDGAVMRDVHLTLHPASSSVEIGGSNIVHALHAVRLTCDAQTRAPLLELELQTYPVVIDGRVSIRITDACRDALIALGWTPPAD